MLSIVLHAVIGIPAGMVFANAMEWVIHKYLLHERGSKKGSFWSFHWYDHHNAARRLWMGDPDYESSMTWAWNARTKEAAGLIGGGLAMTPLLWLAPGFVLGVWSMQIYYYYVHKRSHLDAEWAREKLTWHYDHHMGPNQHANWCVTFPWFDLVMGTRDYYAGTEKEAADRARWEKKQERRRKKEGDTAGVPLSVPM